MFYYIQGILDCYDSQYAVLDCGGVGYKLSVSGYTLGRIAGKTSQSVKLFTHMKVSDDAIELFGFCDETELHTFRLLISVSGVGAKSAIAILSLMPPDRLSTAIASGDAKAISRAPGVGAKTAARIILELKDKVSATILNTETGEVISEPASLTATASDALDTLMTLGYTRREATDALSSVNTTGRELEDIIRDALKKLIRN